MFINYQNLSLPYSSIYAQSWNSYAAVAWDPHQCNNIQILEKTQHRASRWVINDYNRYSNVQARSQGGLVGSEEPPSQRKVHYHVMKGPLFKK